MPNKRIVARLTLEPEFIIELPETLPEDLDEGNIDSLFEHYGAAIHAFMEAKGGARAYVRGWRFDEVPIIEEETP